MILSLEQLKQHDFALSDVSVIFQTPTWDRLGVKTAVKGRKLNGFILVTEGQCRYEWDDESAVLNPGALFYLPSGCRRTAIVTRRPFSFYRISFTVTELSSGEAVVFSRSPRVVAESQDGRLAALAEAMVKSTLSRTDTFRSSALLLEFFDTLSRKLKPSADSRIDPALEYLHAHYTEPVDTAHLARLCALSDSQFYAVFRKRVGMSPLRYRNRLRLEQAKLLLAGEECTKQEIAELLGFESLYYFSRFFKAHTGMSPSQYEKAL